MILTSLIDLSFYNSDVNECDLGYCDVSNTQDCDNSPPGSYTCHCKEGFTGTHCTSGRFVTQISTIYHVIMLFSQFWKWSFIICMIGLLEAVVLNGYEYDVTNVALSWSDAQQYCQDNNAVLTSITSAEENEFLTGFATATYNCGSSRYKAM